MTNKPEIEMKDKPIIFSPPMAKSVHDGSKTVTRRLDGLKQINENPDNWDLSNAGTDPEANLFTFRSTFRNTNGDISYLTIKCPFGPAGRKMWVREKHCIAPDTVKVIYFADYLPDASGMETTVSLMGGRWKPSIHMFRADSRMDLLVLDIAPERLLRCVRDDLRKEGVSGESEFKGLWVSLNGKQSWDLNPWVWRIEFRRIK